MTEVAERISLEEYKRAILASGASPERADGFTELWGERIFHSPERCKPKDRRYASNWHRAASHACQDDSASHASGIDFLVVRQHLDKLLDASGTRLRLFRRLDTEQDGIAVLVIQGIEEIFCRRIAVQCALQIRRDAGFTLAVISRVPTAICFRQFYLP